MTTKLGSIKCPWSRRGKIGFMQERDVNDEGLAANLPENGEATVSNEAAGGPLGEDVVSTSDVSAEHEADTQAPKRGGSAWKFAGGMLLGVAAFVGVMVAIGVRWENADLSPETPSELEVTRQNLAEQAARIDTSADALLAKKADATVELVGTAAEHYLDMLGGVWVPWPSGAPSGYTNPPVATAAPDDVTSDVLTEELTSFSQALLDAVEDVPDENRVEILSAALGSQFLAMNLGGNAAPTCGTVDISAAGIALAGAESIDESGPSAAASSHATTAHTTPSHPATTSTSTPATTATATTEAAATTPATAAPSTATDNSALRVIDTARQWLETDTAAMAEDSRGAQVTRIEKFAALEESILRTGVLDTRDAYSPYPDLQDGETYTSQALRLTTAEILKTAATTNGDGRNNLMNLACSLHLTATERASALPFPGAE